MVLLSVREDLNFLLDNLDSIQEPSEALELYMHHRGISFVILSLFLFFRLCLIVYVERNQELLKLQLTQLYNLSD